MCLIVNEYGDGGDMAHNMPQYYISLDYLKLRTEFEDSPLESFNRDANMIGFMNKSLNLQPGEYVRHADTDKWYSKLKYMSRDNTASLVAGFTYFGNETRLREIYKQLKRRSFFHWNTEESDPPHTVKTADLLGVSELRNFIARLPELKHLKLLLPLLDLDLLYGIYIRRWDSDIKLFTQFLTVEKTQTTFISRIAAYLYKKKSVSNYIYEAYAHHSLKVEPIGSVIKKAYKEWCEKDK